MLKSYKYRIYPNDLQKESLGKYFGCVRFVYNLGLETKIQCWTSNKKNITYFDLCAQLKNLKDNEAPFLKKCNAQVLQMSLRHLDNAYTRFFKGAGFPKFKNKYSKQSIQFPQSVKVDFKNSIIKIPKIGKIPCIYDREFTGKIKTVTLSKTPTNKYFVSILIENQDQIPAKKPVVETTTVGIDLGIKTLAVLSNGSHFDNPKWFRSAQKNLRVQQRSLARKKPDSKRREKQRLVVAEVHEYIANQRKDYLQKLTTNLIDQYDTICLEDLGISGMMKNHCLSKAIGEIGWYQFKTMLQYKAEWYGKNIIEIGRFEPSSKICSTCGTINKELQLKDRIWSCKCGVTHDRDHNAAINIKNFGLRNRPSLANVIR